MRQYLTLAFMLFKRDFKARYRRSSLGWLWALLPPIITIIIFNLLRGVVEIPSDGVPYLVFSTASVIPWTFFNGAVSTSAPSILSNSNILKKSSIPRELFPIVGIISSFVNFLITLSILILMMVYFRLPLTINLLWFPVLVIVMALLSLGIGFGVAAIGVFRRDILNALPVVLRLLLFATPIAYSYNAVPELYKPIFAINPLTGLIESFRNILIFGTSPDFYLLSLSTTLSIVIFLLGWLIFRQTAPYFTDVL